MVLIYPLIYPLFVQVHRRQGIESPDEAITLCGELQEQVLYSFIF